MVVDGLLYRPCLDLGSFTPLFVFFFFPSFLHWPFGAGILFFSYILLLFGVFFLKHLCWYLCLFWLGGWVGSWKQGYQGNEKCVDAGSITSSISYNYFEEFVMENDSIMTCIQSCFSSFFFKLLCFVWWNDICLWKALPGNSLVFWMYVCPHEKGTEKRKKRRGCEDDQV